MGSLCAAKKNSFELNNRIDSVDIFLVKFSCESSDWMSSGARNWISILHRIFGSTSNRTKFKGFNTDALTSGGGIQSLPDTTHETHRKLYSHLLFHYRRHSWRLVLIFQSLTLLASSQPIWRNIFLPFATHTRSSSISVILFIRQKWAFAFRSGFVSAHWVLSGICNSSKTISLQRALYFHLKCTNLRFRFFSRTLFSSLQSLRMALSKLCTAHKSTSVQKHNLMCVRWSCLWSVAIGHRRWRYRKFNWSKPSKDFSIWCEERAKCWQKRLR